MGPDTSTINKAPKASRGKRPSRSLASSAQSAEASRRAAVVLEVLAGALSPSQAAALVGVSTPRYYMLESRALEGLVAACEPQPRGPSRSAEKDLGALRRKYARVEHECARYQALWRAAHRTLGLAHSKEPPATGRRKRRPTVRALKAAGRLKAAVAGGQGPPAGTQPAAVSET